MKNLVSRFAKDESGATAIEYGLIAALISVVIITVVGIVASHAYKESAEASLAKNVSYKPEARR